MSNHNHEIGPAATVDVVLCGGTARQGDIYLPTTYEHSDDFGMLGGEMRVIAAVARARHGLSQHVLFSGGKSKKGAAARGGEHVPAPPAATVYAGHFTNMFVNTDGQTGEGPRITPILLDTVSPNTNANMLYSLQLAQREGWRDMVVISSEYHMPRVTALYSIIKEKLCMDGIRTTFLAAEDVVRAAHPGLYDDSITAAYKSEAGQLRLASEAHGLADMRAGRYSFTEVTAAELGSVYIAE
jgi:hypothetical protein